MTRIFVQAFKDLARRIRDWHRRAPLRSWLCLIAFAASFGYALAYRITPSVDARKFQITAVNIVTRHTFCYTCDVPLAKDTAIRDIGPAYQFFLAGVYSIFGIRLWAVWFIQALLHAIVVAMIWRLLDRALRGTSEDLWTRLVPVGMYAVHPDIVQGNAMLMADGLFTFLFVGSVMVFLPYLEARAPTGWKRPAALGALIGLLAMVKPTGLPLFIAILAVLAWRRLWKAAILAVCCFVAVQAPWAIRNAITYDHFIYNSVVGGLDMWVGLHPDGAGEFEMSKLPDVSERIKGLDPEELDRVAMAEAKKIVRERPVFAFERTAQKFFKLFALTKTSGFWFHYFGAWDQIATVALSALSNLVLLGLAGAAIVYAGWKRIFGNAALWVAVIAIGLLSVGPTIAVVINRYRIPMLPFVAVLAAYWIAVVRNNRERVITLAGAFGFLALCTGIDLSGSWSKVLERIGRLS